MNLWEAIKSLFGYGIGKDPAVIDHVQGDGNDTGYDEKLLRARKRHGREFHAHEQKKRETPPSRNLIEIQETQAAIAEKRRAKRRAGDAEAPQKLLKIAKS